MGTDTRTKRRIEGGKHNSENPFCATRPDLAGRRNATESMDDSESITLSPAQELQPREHANPNTLLVAKRVAAGAWRYARFSQASGATATATTLQAVRHRPGAPACRRQSGSPRTHL